MSDITVDSIYDYLETPSTVQSEQNTYQGDSNDDDSDYDSYARGIYNAHVEPFEFYYVVRDLINDGSLSLQSKIDSIASIENNFDFSSLTSDQEEAIWKAGSIARYSLYMWAPTGQGGLGYGDAIDQAKAFDWNAVAQDDIWGAVVGALFTKNPAVALAGGAASSAVSALRQGTS